MRLVGHVACMGDREIAYRDLTGSPERKKPYGRPRLIWEHNIKISGFGGLGVARWPLVSKFAVSNPAEAVGFLRAKKILSTPSFGGEVKPSVPCRRFATCKRSLNGAEVVISAKLPDNILAHISP